MQRSERSTKCRNNFPIRSLFGRAHSKPVLHLPQPAAGQRGRRNASFTRITTRTLDDLSRSVGGSRRRPSAGYSGYNNTTNATAAAASSSSSSTHILTRTLSLSLSVYAEGGGRDAAQAPASASARPSAAARRRATCLSSVVEQGTEAAEKGSPMLRRHKPLPLHRFIEHCMGR